MVRGQKVRPMETTRVIHSAEIRSDLKITDIVALSTEVERLRLEVRALHETLRLQAEKPPVDYNANARRVFLRGIEP